MAEPADHGLQRVPFVPNVKLLHRQQLAQTVGRLLQELLRVGHVSEMSLKELRGHVEDVVQAVMQGEHPDADAVFCRDAALQELTAQRF